MLGLGLFFLPSIAAADLSWKNSTGEFIAEAHISAEKSSLNQPIEVTLLLTYPANYSINLDQLSAALLSHPAIELTAFKIVSRSENKVIKEGENQHEIKWILQPEMEGDYYLSFFDIIFKPILEAQSKPTRIVSNIFKVSVSKDPLPLKLFASGVLPLAPNFPIEMDANLYRQYVANKELEKKEAHRNVEIFQSATFPWILTLIIPLLMLFIYLLWRAPLILSQEITSEKRRKMILNEIVKLQKMEIPPDKLYEKLDLILRDFFQFQYQIKAPKLTAIEFIRELKAHKELEEPVRNKVIEFISNSETIKFAKKQPSIDDCSLAERTLLELVQKE